MSSSEPESSSAEQLANELASLQQQIAAAQQEYSQIANHTLAEIEQRHQNLLVSIEQLERKRDRIQAEISQSFAGSSQEIAIRIQGFKDYLVGSLQDLVAVAEEIDFPEPPAAPLKIAPAPNIQIQQTPTAPPTPALPSPEFAEPTYQSNARRIRELLKKYQTAPDYYGEPWQIRRTLEQNQIDRSANWFLKQGGRGAVKSLSGRLQNVLVASASISVLRELYGDYLRVLILANSPERLGEWRRGLQDCLGLGRGDFGPNGGIILFEAPDPLTIKAEKIMAERDMPFIIVDDSEGYVSLALLQYPIWLAFAPEPNPYPNDYRY
jgi:Protein of unknown function (DUF3086)